ncbi:MULTISPECIES: ABC transporter ATP-binding protein [unclassified Devosia]|uniref:ATP-binding cassette domain-containing protein n=1 Tax=unclassified Devosia TaxID=196773 RepID=UPI001556CD01
MTVPSVFVDNLSHSYAGKLALDKVSLTIARGSSFALLGPNGAGKTTLISILCTLQKADSGTAEVDGIDVRRSPTAARKRIGVVFQDSSLDDRLSAYENLNFHGLVYGMAARDRRQRIGEMLALVELEDWRDAIVRSFSGGMRRRLEIARALLHNPAILFLDEPTVGLDAQTRERIWQYLDQLRRERELTVLTTTHYIEEVETADQVCIINNGVIVNQGSPAELKLAHGRSWLHVVPRDEGVRQAILQRFPETRDLGSNRLAVPVTDEGFVDHFLASFGSQLSEMRLEQPSLESVFLALTGTELRDRAAGRRDAEQAAGRRAGRR